MTMESVSVIIPNYNGKKYLDDCIGSLKKQTYRDFCVIIVDNGSTDGSCEYIRNNYPEVKLIALQKNIGFAGAVNVGIKAAEGKYVFLLNNDTICDKEAISKLVETLSCDNKLFGVQAKMLQMKNTDIIDDAGDYYCALGWAFAPSKDKNSSAYTQKKYVTSACAGAALYRRDVFEKIGYFDEVHFCYLEDVDIGYRARLYGYKNACEPKSLVYHVGSGSSGSRHNTFKVELTASNNLYFIYKNMPFLQVIINIPFILAGIFVKHLFYAKKGLGMAHIRGLIKGIKKILDNPDKKVHFGGEKLLSSIKMQLELWKNCFLLLRWFVAFI